MDRGSSRRVAKLPFFTPGSSWGKTGNNQLTLLITHFYMNQNFHMHILLNNAFQLPQLKEHFRMVRNVMKYFRQPSRKKNIEISQQKNQIINTSSHHKWKTLILLTNREPTKYPIHSVSYCRSRFLIISIDRRRLAGFVST